MLTTVLRPGTHDKSFDIAVGGLKIPADAPSRRRRGAERDRIDARSRRSLLLDWGAGILGWDGCFFNGLASLLLLVVCPCIHMQHLSRNMASFSHIDIASTAGSLAPPVFRHGPRDRCSARF